MRLRICIILLLVLFSNKIYCQKYYINGGVGYGINSIPILIENKIYGFGSLGYNLSTKFDIEISINNFSAYGKLVQLDNMHSDSIKIIRVMPFIKFKFTKSLNSFYLKGGFSFGLGGYRLASYLFTNDVPPFQRAAYKVQFSGGVSPGGIFAFGKDFALHQDKWLHSFNLFVELIAIGNFSWYPNNENILYLYGDTKILNPYNYFFATGAMQMGLKFRF